jgi:hypothetical protein
MKYLTEEKLKDFRDKFGDLFHYINMVDWIEAEINEAVIKVSRVDAEVKVNFADTKKEFDKFFHLYQYTYAPSPDILLVGNRTDKLWEWFEQKLKEASKISA